MTDLEKLGAKLREIPGTAELLDKEQAALETMKYKVTVGPFSELATALAIVEIAWSSGVMASIAKTSKTAVVTVGPIDDLGAAAQLVRLVNNARPHVKFQVLEIPADDPQNPQVIIDGPHGFVSQDELDGIKKD